MSFYKSIRVLILLFILFIVAANQWKTRAKLASWEQPVWITIYPVLTEGSDDIRPYVDKLSANSYAEIGEFLRLQGKYHGRQLNMPVMFQMAPPIFKQPPALPDEGAMIQTVFWSLKMRWWTWRRDREDGLPGADVQMFVQFHNIDHPQFTERSVGVQNGMYGIVNVFAHQSYAKVNRIVITHELLHILGASDKYYMSTSQPINPIGLAEPGRIPLYPQKLAEIMGGRIAVSDNKAVMPKSLKECVIGAATALEIGWD
jgi:hypothetical protein